MKVLTLTGPVARKAACQFVLSAPEGWTVKIGEPGRTLEQNALLHAELSEISEKLKWGGEFQDIETWKRLLTAAWMRATGQKVTLLPAVDGHGVDALYRRTSRMGKAEMIDLIEYVKAWKADQEEFA